MQKSFIRFIIAAWIVSAAGLYAQQPPKEQQVPDELTQYVRDARKAGSNEKQIQQNALSAGWPADVVTSAIAAAFHPGAAKTASRDAAPAATTEEAPDKVVELPSTNAAPPAAAPAKSNEPAPTPATSPAPTTGLPAAAAPEGGTPKIPSAVDHGVPDTYEIGAGDDLQINVWKEPDASVQGVVVRPDGKITLPMIKDISVVGITPTQAEKLITEQLTKFIAAPDVTVIVKAINSKKIYIVGGVKKEGPIPYTYRMTILQALSEAGGLTDYAKKKRIYVLRHENGRDFQLPFDYDAALRGAKMDLNIPLIPGDTIVVPK